MPDVFADVLSTPLEDIKETPIMPVGTYLAVISGPVEERDGQNDNGPWKAYDFPVSLVSAVDVDQTALEASGGIKENLNLKKTFFFNKKMNSQADMKAFLTIHLGIGDHEVKPDASGKITLGSYAAHATGRRFLATLKTRPSDSGRVFIDIGKTAAAA